jgi:hypothetical protein
VEFGAIIVVKADMTGDGFPDLLLKADRDEMCVFQGRGNGAYTEEPVKTLAVPQLKGFFVTGGIEPLVGDFTGDGRAELAFVASNSEARKCCLFVVFGE